jgi:uncharacterized protein (TIGR03437 family)
MMNARLRKLWLGLVLCCAPAFSQTVTYQVSFPGVTSGPVLVPAFGFQYVSQGFLQPEGNGLTRLIGNPGFAMNGAPPGGFTLTDAVFFPNAGAPYFSLGFVNGATSLLVDFRPEPASPLLAAGSYQLAVRTSLLAAGAPAVAGNAATGTLLIATSTASKPALSVSPAVVNLTFRPPYPPDSIPLAVITNGASVSFTALVSDPVWMMLDPTTGGTPTTLRLMLLPYSLPTGVHNGTITITAPAASNPITTVNISLTVAPLSPVVHTIQVSNTGSFAPADAPNGGIAQGSLFAVFGDGIGPQTLVQSGYPLQTRLAGTSAKITVKSVTVDALMVYTSSRQIAAILPSRTPVGDGTITVTYDGTDSQPYPIKIVSSALGVYTVTSNGLGPGIITGADYGIKTLQAPARQGETVILWGTGLGAVDGDEAVPPTPANRFSPQVFAGGKQGKVTYAGRAGCCSGLDQINFEVPEGVSGCFVPVAVRNGGVTSNFTTLPVSSAGACSDPYGFPTDLLTRGAGGSTIKAGFAAVGPLTILHGFGFLLTESVAARLSAVVGKRVDPSDVAKLIRAHDDERAQLATQLAKKYGVRTVSRARQVLRELRSLVSNNSEGFVALFSSLANLAAVAPQYASMFPPPGSCTVFPSLPTTSGSGKGQLKPLDGGEKMTVTGPAGTTTLTRFKPGEYQGLLGTNFAPLQAPVGTYLLSGSGGGDFGSFSASMRVSNALQWSNKGAITSVDRSQSLTVTWSGGPAPGYVVFGGYVAKPSRSAFLCTEDAAKGSLTVPQYVLSAMPAATSPNGYVFLAAHPLAPRFTIPGLDIGFFFDLSSDGKAMEFR